MTQALAQGAILKTGRIEKTNEEYALWQLAPDALDAVTLLQERVLATTPDHDAHFLVPKSKAQFWHYLHGHGAMVIALTINNIHVAQIIVRSEFDKNEQNHHLTALGNIHDYALVQGALSHPDYRGRGLLNIMLDYMTQTLPANILLARVVPENIASWHAFMKAGYVIKAVDTDPDDERRVFYMMHDNKPYAPAATRLVDRHEFHALQALCRDGWRGTSFDKTTGMIEFVR